MADQKSKKVYKAPPRGPSTVKRIGYVILLVLVAWQLFNYAKKSAPHNHIKNMGTNESTNDFGIDLPSSNTASQIIHHTFYSLAYSEPHEQAQWIAYELTRDELNAPKTGRFDYFSPDHAVRSKSAIHRDYTGSGYTRGHLAPAADMSYDIKASEESFFMSNISPQKRYFNQGVWRELEENVRDWARRNKRLLIVTGPVLTNGIREKIGENRVSVPSLFYKVLLDTVSREMKGIGFILPNEKSERPLENFMVSIDSVETMTEIDFFNSQSKNEVIETIERMMDKTQWPLNKERYSKRLKEWNKN